MQNIDPLFILEPIVVIGFSLALVLYWHRKHSISRAVLAFSLLAYGGAIAVKLLFQYVTAPFLLPRFSGSDWLLGLYLGLQTVVFEVGGAFLVSRFAVSKGKMRGSDAEGYGLSLALWENGGLIGALALINVLYYAAVISSGGPMADYLYGLLSKTQPQLFYSPLEATPLIAWGILERVGSLLVHFSWGYLCVKSAYEHRKEYFLLALPMGMIDFLVPFVQGLTVPIFECTVFVLSVVCLIVSLEVTRPKKKPSRVKRSKE
jgi:hypothetical protein